MTDPKTLQKQECSHTRQEWYPDREDPGCEDGKWKCLACGAEKERAYRPLLEVWKRGEG